MKQKDSSSTKRRKKSASESPKIKEDSSPRSDKASKIQDNVIVKPESSESVREVKAIQNKPDKTNELHKRSQSDKESIEEVKLSPPAEK